MKFNRYLIEADDIPEPTQEMKRYYNQRTYEHIAYVNKGANKLSKAFPEMRSELMNRAKAHDASKFQKHEYIPYVWMSWKRKKGNESFKFPEGVQDAVDKAIQHHLKSNRHHPESHSNPDKMTVLDIAEMVCDWHAFHYEFGDDTKKWADDNIGKRWKFNKMTTKLIYKYIEVLMK